MAAAFAMEQVRPAEDPGGSGENLPREWAAQATAEGTPTQNIYTPFLRLPRPWLGGKCSLGPSRPWEQRPLCGWESEESEHWGGVWEPYTPELVTSLPARLRVSGG